MICSNELYVSTKVILMIIILGVWGKDASHTLGINTSMGSFALSRN